MQMAAIAAKAKAREDMKTSFVEGGGSGIA
jgi:hypothetical protein